MFVLLKMFTRTAEIIHKESFKDNDSSMAMYIAVNCTEN